MQEVVSQLDQEVLLGLCGMALGALGIIGGITVGIAVVVSSHYRRTQLDEMEATLKMEMIQRGMSADDIAKVLEARVSAKQTQLVGLGRNFVLGLNAHRCKTQKTAQRAENVAQ